MKLEKFDKNKKGKIIVVGVVLGLFLIIGGVYLFRSHAIFEEHKTFDVIFGKVPPFKKKEKDLELAILVDGASSSEIPEGKDYRVNVVCDDEALTGTWDYTKWKLKIEGTFTQATTCSIKFDSIIPTYTIIKDLEEINEFPEKGDYIVKMECTNAKNYNWDKENWKPVYSVIDQTKEITCTVNFGSANLLYTNAEVGDYVAYTPSNTSYEISAESTGCSVKQTINPSELNLWRVIKKNDDGTIEIVSEYVGLRIDGHGICFYGKEGYRRFVGTLNEIASAYETEGITENSHHIGYDGEQESCSSYTSCSDHASSGLSLSENMRLVNKAYGGSETCTKSCTSLKAYKSNAVISATDYWIASRYNASLYYGRSVNSDGSLDTHDLVSVNAAERSFDNGVRPIVILKSGLTASKLGDKIDTNQNKTFKQWQVN